MDDRERLRLVIIVGSGSQGRFGLTAGEWLASQAMVRNDFDVDVIDLATAWLPDRMSVDREIPRPSAVRDLSPWLAAADAFAVVTSEYRRSYPASLKNSVDWYDREWHAKPVGFVSYGGACGGRCAVSQLRPAFMECHAVTVCETVSFPHPSADRGGEADHLDTEERRSDAWTMLDRLAWWARALREARIREPYDSADRPRVEE